MSGIKKQRGLKRYYKNLASKIDFDRKTWLDFENTETWERNWHIHFDYEGHGNNSFKKRKPHLDKLFRHFDLLVDKTKKLKKGFHLYTVLLDFDSHSDALFLHTPNQNNSQFPFKISDLKLDTTLTNGQLNDYINNLEGFEKLYGKGGEAFCLIYKKNVGQPF
ncbi:hypothetical protein [Parasediminibacterium sp. JCM 36343]|uniref:hypothetical protein n=1 Tax=Parasediminibacterium sp. JCM 36343 TaxID=3374279 RepID=UPI00397E88F7